MEKVNYYKQAPTWLYNMAGETRFCKTQDEVDQAWEDGWFGPPFMAKTTALMSSVEFESKAEMKRAVEDDPRYSGLTINLRKNKDELLMDILAFEEEHDIQPVIVGGE